MDNQYKLLKDEGYVKGVEVTGIGKNTHGNTCLHMAITTPQAPGTYNITIDGWTEKTGESQQLYTRNLFYKTKIKPSKRTGKVRPSDEEHNRLWDTLYDAVKQGKKVEIFYKVRGTLYFNEELQEEVWRLDAPLTKFETKDKKLFGSKYK